MILVMPKQEWERESEWLCGLKSFHFKFEVKGGNGVWTQFRILASGFFQRRQFGFTA